MKTKLNILAFSYTTTILAAISMLILGILGSMGIYTGAVEMMQQWHLFFSLTVSGIIFGILEASILTFSVSYFFGWLYNYLVNKV